MHSSRASLPEQAPERRYWTFSFKSQDTHKTLMAGRPFFVFFLGVGETNRETDGRTERNRG